MMIEKFRLVAAEGEIEVFLGDQKVEVGTDDVQLGDLKGRFNDDRSEFTVTDAKKARIYDVNADGVYVFGNNEGDEGLVCELIQTEVQEPIAEEDVVDAEAPVPTGGSEDGDKPTEGAEV